MADPDPMTCDPGSRVYDPDPGTVIPDPIYLVTTLRYLQPKGSFFVLLVGFPIAKLLFSTKEWGKKVKLGQF